MSDDSDLIDRLVRAALRGDLHVPDISHFLTEEPETPELVQPLRDLYAAIVIFIDNVNCSRSSTTVEEGDSGTSAGADDDQTQTRPSPEPGGCSTSCRNAHVEIAFRKEDKVVTLLPKNKEQCRDLPLLMSQASALGASDAGVFKYVLSDDIDFKVSSGQAASSSSFSSSYDNAAGGFRVTYHQTDDPITVKPTTCAEPRPELLATQLEDILNDPNRLSQMRYCTDHPAKTEEQRRACGLPSQSPIYPLPHNKLDDTLYDIDGLHSPYAYLSNRYGGIFLIHTEDGQLWSINVLYRGSVHWTTVDPKDAPLVEKLRSRWHCGQKMRHERLYLTQKQLDDMGVSYRQFVQYPGEVVVTCGNTYHQGGDLGNKVAEAVNFAPPTWSIKGYKECKRGRGGCPGFPIPSEYLRFRRPSEQQMRQDDPSLGDAHDGNAMRPFRNKQMRPTGIQETTAKTPSKRQTMTTSKSPGKRMGARSHPPNTSKRRKLSAVDPSLSQMEQFLKNVDRNCVIPLRRQPGVPSFVLKLVSAVLSTPAIVAFCDLAKSTFSEFCLLVEELELARMMECKRKGRIRNDSQAIKHTLEACDLDYETFRRHESQGRKLLRLCRPYPGIICFLLINQRNDFDVSRADYLGLSDADLGLFHTLLDCDHTKTINTIGEKFLDSLSPIADDVEFRWESQKVLWHKLSMPQALEKLAPIPWEMKNVYAPEDYPDWPRPSDWPDDWDWPMDPTSFPAADQPKCELCLQPQCDCVHARFAHRDRPQPRIKDYGGKGRGIQAVASYPGHIAYVCGEHIGIVWGKIVPVGAHSGKMVMNFVRPDILYEPAVCELYCEDTGSFLRLINHSCRPSARVATMRVSGQYTLVVVATRDIYDREEITAKFGKASFDGPCLCGSCEHCTKPRCGPCSYNHVTYTYSNQWPFESRSSQGCKVWI